MRKCSCAGRIHKLFWWNSLSWYLGREIIQNLLSSFVLIAIAKENAGVKESKQRTSDEKAMIPPLSDLFQQRNSSHSFIEGATPAIFHARLPRHILDAPGPKLFQRRLQSQAKDAATAQHHQWQLMFSRKLAHFS